MRSRSSNSPAPIHLLAASPKRIFFLAAAFALGSVGLPCCRAQVVRSGRELNKSWTFRQTAGPEAASRANWMPATVPGDVHLDLLKQKLIPDPFYRDNESKLQWIENASWEYETTIMPTSAELEAQNLDLVFDGLDAACKVYLNDKLVLDADNMHRSWRVSVKTYMHPGSNKLRVVFPSPIEAAHAVASTDGWQAKTGVTDQQYIRKASYEYGWDWGPRFVTSGIWKPVRLEAWGKARISNLHVHQQDISAVVAHVTAEVEVDAATAGTASITVDYGSAGPNVHRSVELVAGVNHVDLPIQIMHPRLWFPAGYGAQSLYVFTARVTMAAHTEDEASQSVGLRSLSLRRDIDHWGRSFEFVVNGIPVFAKGADVIPIDSFPSRVTVERYESLLKSARDANMNMIRVWGGGYYETDEFYTLCDKLGLMVWQDFMFGNQWQPGTYAFKQEIEREGIEQVRRLRDHPSIVLWCGNNEMESLFDHWAPAATHPPAVRFRMWEDYVTEFHGVMSRVVERLDPEVPYWSSSPSADFEAHSASFITGDVHDWSVWHGRLPFSAYDQHDARFVSEFGFQSFPDIRTIDSFTLPEDRSSIFTPVMLSHQKSGIGNQVIKNYMDRDYPEPKDFSSFVYVSQVLQAEGVKVGAEHWRREKPETMGVIFWQLNDCWPVASWSSIDSSGRWKALQYYARRFYQPVLVSPHVEDGAVKTYIISDKTQSERGVLRVRLMDFNGRVLIDNSQSIQVDPLSSKVEAELPLSKISAAAGKDLSQFFIKTDWTPTIGESSSNLLYMVPTKQIHLPSLKLSTELTGEQGAYTLRITSPKLARSVHVSFGDLDASVSDDFFDLLPGETRSIRVKSAESLNQLRRQLLVMSLVDAFSDSNGKTVAANNK